jgi:hypothetical protein
MSHREIGRESKQENIVHAISLDYDGCGEVLFSASPSKAKKSDKPGEVNRQELARKFSLSSSESAKKFSAALGAMVGDGKQTTLYIGSNRQASQLDMVNRLKNKNGSCRENYLSLAREKGWQFDPMQVLESWDRVKTALTENEQAQAELDADKVNQELRAIKRSVLLRTLTNLTDDQALKIYLITKQIEKISELNPGKTIHFHFIDDRPDILAAVNFYFTRVSAPPKNLVLNLYDYVFDAKNPDPSSEEVRKIGEIKHSSLSRRPYLTAALIGGLGSIVPIAFGFPLYAIVLIPAALSLLAVKLSGEIKLVNPEDKKILLGLSMFAAVLLCGGAAALALGAFEFAVAGAVIMPLIASGPIGIALFCAGVAAAFAYIAYDIYKSWPTETVINGANTNYGADPYQHMLKSSAQASSGPSLSHSPAPGVSSQEESQAQASAAPAPDVLQAQSGQASYDAAALQPSQQPQGWASSAGPNARVAVEAPQVVQK